MIVNPEGVPLRSEEEGVVGEPCSQLVECHYDTRSRRGVGCGRSCFPKSIGGCTLYTAKTACSTSVVQKDGLIHRIEELAFNKRMQVLKALPNVNDAKLLELQTTLYFEQIQHKALPITTAQKPLTPQLSPSLCSI